MNTTNIPEQYDVIIVGGAAAGLTAALYCARRKLKTLVLTKDIGGQASMTNEIENYPGVNKLVDGFWLMNEFKQQAEKFGATIEIAHVQEIRQNDELDFRLRTASTEYSAKTVILAFGLTPKSLNVPGEQEYTGKGVSYCATCDAPLFANKDVLVIGHSPAAMDAAILCARSKATSVTMVTERDEFRGRKELLQAIEEIPTITQETGVEISEIHGTTFVERVTGTRQGESAEWNVQGVFVELGHNVQTDLIEGLVDLDNTNHVRIDDKNMTSVEGIFAAGDVTSMPYKQVVTSAGEGCKAALQAYAYLQKKGQVRAAGVDWGTVV